MHRARVWVSRVSSALVGALHDRAANVGRKAAGVVGNTAKGFGGFSRDSSITGWVEIRIA